MIAFTESYAKKVLSEFLLFAFELHIQFLHNPIITFLNKVYIILNYPLSFVRHTN